ncbi:MAG: hypothetical protein AB1450_12060 [Pseudomonadota bacterium]
MAHGWGAVTVGMSLTAAEAALGEPLVETDPGLDGCFYVEPVSRPGVEFMVLVDVIVRIESTKASVGATSGIRLGDPISKIIAVFEEAKVGPNHYLDGWRDVFIADASGKYGLLFEVDDEDRIVGIRGGDLRYVGMVERCA